MKRIMVIAMLAMICSMTFAQATVFDKYKNNKDVSVVYIGKAMLSMMKNKKIGGYDVGKISSGIDKIYILDCEKKRLLGEIKAYVVSYMKRNKYEVAMTVNDDGEDVTIYHKSLPGNKNDFYLLNVESDEVTVINMSGTVSLQDIQAFNQ